MAQGTRHEHRGEQPELAGRLIIEITESQATLDLESTRSLFDAVRQLGCRIAIDDFGAGYTSFRNLKLLPFDIIKIDGEFARDLVGNPKNQVFIRALIDIAHAFSAKIVVEWVTDEETAALLEILGCRLSAGLCLRRTPHRGAVG